MTKNKLKSKFKKQHSKSKVRNCKKTKKKKKTNLNSKSSQISRKWKALKVSRARKSVKLRGLLDLNLKKLNRRMRVCLWTRSQFKPKEIAMRSLTINPNIVSNISSLRNRVKLIKIRNKRKDRK